MPKQKIYVFRHNEAHEEIIMFKRVKGEYREVCEHDIWRDNKRLYPFLKITRLSYLVAELLELNYQLVTIYE